MALFLSSYLKSLVDSHEKVDKNCFAYQSFSEIIDQNIGSEFKFFEVKKMAYLEMNKRNRQQSP